MSNGREWTPTDTSTLRRLVAAGKTDAAIGGDMGRDREFIRDKRHEHNIEPGLSRAARGLIARLNLQRLRRAAV